MTASIQRTPNLASFLKEAEKLESVPGYGKDSAAEDMAPITPRATPSDEESISNSVSEHSIQAGKSESSSRPASEASAEEDALTEEAPRSSSFSLASGNSGYMAPPLPLKIRTDRSESGSPNAFSDRSGPTPVAKAAELPPVGTPTLTQIGEQNVTSPGGESRASTTIPYDIPSVTNSPQQRVTFASEVQEHPDTPTAKAGMSSKFAAGLKLKAWSGKNSQKDNHSYSSQPKEAGSPGQAKEPAKSPLPGLKGFKWWQKEGNSHHDESSQSRSAFHSYATMS